MPSLRAALVRSVTVVLLCGSFFAATAQDRPFNPRAAGREPRHDAWNSDGAPRPPAMWRGHGGTRWTNHYRACRKAYGARYNYRTDLIGRGRTARRCAL